MTAPYTLLRKPRLCPFLASPGSQCPAQPVSYTAVLQFLEHPLKRPADRGKGHLWGTTVHRRRSQVKPLNTQAQHTDPLLYPNLLYLRGNHMLPAPESEDADWSPWAGHHFLFRPVFFSFLPLQQCRFPITFFLLGGTSLTWSFTALPRIWRRGQQVNENGTAPSPHSGQSDGCGCPGTSRAQSLRGGAAGISSLGAGTAVKSF